MIRCDGITEVAEHVRVFDVLHSFQFQTACLEEGRVVDVGRFVLPFVLDALLDFETVPSVGTLGDTRVVLNEHFGSDNLSGNRFDFFSGWPDVSEEDIIAFLVLAQGLSVEIEVHVTSECVRDDQRR